MNIKITNLIGGLVAIVFGAGVYYRTLSFPPSPRPVEPGAGFFPQILAGLFGILGLSLIIQGIGKRGEASINVDIRDPRVRKKVFVSGLTILYIFSLPYVGFIISTFLFLVALMKYLGTKGYVKVIAIAAGCSFLFFYVFKTFLLIDLPIKLPIF